MINEFCPIDNTEKRKLLFKIIRKIKKEYKLDEMNILIDKELKFEINRLHNKINDIDKKLDNFNENDISINTLKYNSNNSIFENIQMNKINSYLKTKQEINISFELSFLREVIQLDDLNHYRLIENTLLAYIDLKSGGNEIKLLSAYKSSLSSLFYRYSNSKNKSESKAQNITESLFFDTKGVNYPRESKVYHGKYISFPIISY